MSDRLDSSDQNTIGHYRILNELGRGGQGVVYLAEDTTLHRRVALKVLQGLAGLSEESLARFRREAAAASRLDHPGICAVYEAALEGRVPYIAMRFVEGKSLAENLATAKGSPSQDATSVHLDEAADSQREPARPRTDPSPTPGSPTTRAEVMQIVHLMEKVARALHAAHEAGVIHRDIKPGNVMVTPDGEPVLMDFGLAQLEDEDLPTLTRPGELFGTPAYMSPEQLLAQRIRLDRRTDVWSIGVMLYECLTRTRPFDAPTREGLYQAIQAKEPIDPRRINHSVPDDLRVVIATALEKDRDRRYQTALDLAEELRRIRMHESIVAKPVGPIVKLVRWGQRNPGLALALSGLFAVLVSALGVSIFLISQRDIALGEARTERNQKQRALDAYEGLADVSRLDKLEVEASELWPCTPERVPAMKEWMQNGAELADRLDVHRSALAHLGSSVNLGAYTERFKHDTTAKLVADLTDFVDPDPHKGLLADVRNRLAFAESVERETIGKYESRWADAVRSVADERECPKYGGLQITPQLGLIPIGRDPSSGLWEFANLQTTGPGADPIPRRHGDGKLVVTEGMGIVFVLLPGGTFRMGAAKAGENHDTSAPNIDPEAEDHEGPVTPVTLDPFFISKYEMTQGQWLRLVGKNPSQFEPGASVGGKVGGLSNPVEQVSWEDCKVWLGRLGLVIPTEAQWEYAARGGTTTPRWPGTGTEGLGKAENLADRFSKENGGPRDWNYESWNDGYAFHAPVGSLIPNGLGLYDALGNVQEWCRDSWGRYEVNDPRPGDGLRSPSAPRNRVVRGGSWGFVASFARSASRGNMSPAFRSYVLGVRPARSVTRP